MQNMFIIFEFDFSGSSSVQDDAELESPRSSPPALLLPDQGEPGQSDPTQTPLSAGLRRKGLSLRRTRVLEVKPTSHSRPFLLLVGIPDHSL